MIYFLGGPPKVGKSIICKAITKKYGINVVSTDSLGAVLENILDPDIVPELFVINKFNELYKTRKYGFEYIEMDTIPFPDVVDRIAASLKLY